MKICPNCRKEYADDVQYCLDDGTVLEGSKKKSEVETVILPSDQSVITKFVESANTRKINEATNVSAGHSANIERNESDRSFQESSLNSWSPRMLSILRIMTGFLMMWHGTQKLFGYPPSQRPPSGDGGMDTLTLVGGILEFGGGVLFLIGFLTRPVAFLLSGTMAVAYWMAHGTRTFLPIQNGGELAALYCFVFLYFVFSGGGAWSVDDLLFGDKRTENS